MSSPRVRTPLVLLLTACASPPLDSGDPAPVASESIVCDPGATAPQPDPCAYHITRTQDATLTMSANVTEKETGVVAPAQATCPAAVVQVSVPSTSSPAPADCAPSGCYSTVEMMNGAGSFAGSVQDGDSDYIYIPKTQAACESYSHWSRICRKSTGQTAFSLLRTRRYRGFWENGLCFVKRLCGPCDSGCFQTYFPDDLYAKDPPASGTDIYRIVTYAKANGAATAMRVKVGYEAM
jgi:hypothetical protein